MTTSLSLNVDGDWWDSRRKDGFFRTVYFRGDDSLEGHVYDYEFGIAERTLRECKAIRQMLRPMRGRKILDCPCGRGRHSLLLAATASFSMTGVDLCEDAISHAQEEAARNAIRDCTFVVGDMRDIPARTDSFDYVLNMFFSFGFFVTDSDNRQAAAEFHRVLCPGGRLLIHTDVNPERLEKGTYSDRSVRTLRDGAELLISEQYNRGSHRLEGSWCIRDRDGQLCESKYSVRIYSHDEMCDILRGAGFSHIEIRVFPPSCTEDIDSSHEIAYIARK